MSYLTIVSALIAVIGVILAMVGVRRLFQRRFIKAFGLEVSAVVLPVALGQCIFAGV